jgi:hypothetical protein
MGVGVVSSDGKKDLFLSGLMRTTTANSKRQRRTAKEVNGLIVP